MTLLSMAIRELGGDAISFTGSQSGIITNDRHVDARIIEVRPFRVQDELARGPRGGDCRLSGRVVPTRGHDARPRWQRHDGGRDGACARSPRSISVRTWTAVSTADLRVEPSATRIGTLSYEETQELAEAGAKVLNARPLNSPKSNGSPSTLAPRLRRFRDWIRLRMERSSDSTRRERPEQRPASPASATSSCCSAPLTVTRSWRCSTQGHRGEAAPHDGCRRRL